MTASELSIDQLDLLQQLNEHGGHYILTEGAPARAVPNTWPLDALSRSRLHIAGLIQCVGPTAAGPWKITDAGRQAIGVKPTRLSPELFAACKGFDDAVETDAEAVLHAVTDITRAAMVQYNAEAADTCN